MYTTRMRIRYALILAVAGLVALAIESYLFMHSLLTKRTTHSSISAAGCTDPNSEEAKKNPNKLYFISCGGFLE